MHWRDFQKLQTITHIDHRFLSYVDEGKGTPVVLIHGIPTWGYVWNGIYKAIAEHNRVLIPDMLGYGYSSKNDFLDRSISVQAGLIDAWMEKNNIEPAAFVAHGIGGGVALRLACLYPHRVSRLLVMNTICYDSWPLEMMVQFGLPSTYRNASASTAMKTMRSAGRKSFASSPTEEVLDGLLAPYTTEVGKRSLIRNAAALNTNQTTELTPLLPKLDIPVTVLWGVDDEFQLVKYGERLARDIPKAEFIPVTRAKHFVMFDQPEQVTRSIIKFLSA